MFDFLMMLIEKDVSPPQTTKKETKHTKESGKKGSKRKSKKL
jgi:hypothetical protein